MIIDTHTHFYDPTRPQGVPWPPKGDKLLYRQVLPRDYKAIAQPIGVTATVVVEASSWLEDNQWILDLARDEPFIVGFVGHLSPGQAGFRDALARFTKNALYRGIRINHGDLAKGLDQPDYVADLEQLAVRDLALDVLGPPAMLDTVDKLAGHIPELRIVMDHVAGVKVDGKAPEARWAAGIGRAASHRNVYCKVSGLVEGTGRGDGGAPRDVAFYTPVLDALWAAFGQRRLIYASNWPVSARFAELATVQGIVSDYVAPKGKAAADDVFWKNAKAAYKWVEREK